MDENYQTQDNPFSGKQKQSVPTVFGLTPVSIGVIAITVLVFGLGQYMVYQMGIASAETSIVLGGLYQPLIVYGRAYWLLVTSGFVHIDILHVLSNLFSFYILSRSIERMYSQSKYLGLILVSIVVGNLFSLAFNQPTLSYGLSGGIFGMVGAYSVFLVETQLIRVPAIRNNLIFVLLLNLVLGISVSNINLVAHIGGFIAGCFFAIAFSTRSDWSGLRLHSRIAGLLLLGIVVFLVLRVNSADRYLGTDAIVIKTYYKFHLDFYADYVRNVLMGGI